MCSSESPKALSKTSPIFRNSNVSISPVSDSAINNFYNPFINVSKKIIDTNDVSSMLELDVNCDSISASATSSSSIESILQTSHSFSYNNIFENIKSNEKKLVTNKINNEESIIVDDGPTTTTTDDISFSVDYTDEIYNLSDFSQHEDLTTIKKISNLTNKNGSHTPETAEEEINTTNFNNELYSNKNLKKVSAISETPFIPPFISMLFQQQQQEQINQQQSALKRDQLASLLSLIYSTQNASLQNLCPPTLSNFAGMRSHVANPDVSLFQKVS